MSFIDCTGIHVLLAAAENARDAGGRLTLICGPANTHRALTLTGVDTRIRVIDLDYDRSAQKTTETVVGSP